MREAVLTLLELVLVWVNEVVTLNKADRLFADFLRRDRPIVCCYSLTTFLEYTVGGILQNMPAISSVSRDCLQR